MTRTEILISRKTFEQKLLNARTFEEVDAIVEEFGGGGILKTMCREWLTALGSARGHAFYAKQDANNWFRVAIDQSYREAAAMIAGGVS